MRIVEPRSTMHREGGGYVTDPATDKANGLACGVRMKRAIGIHRDIIQRLAAMDAADPRRSMLQHNERFSLLGIFVARQRDFEETEAARYLTAHRPHVKDAKLVAAIDGFLKGCKRRAALLRKSAASRRKLQRQLPSNLAGYAHA